MAIESKTVQYAKETDDCLVLLVELVKDIRAKKDAGQLASENLPNLINAIAGAEQIPGEAGADLAVVLATAGSRTGELVAALIAPAA